MDDQLLRQIRELDPIEIAEKSKLGMNGALWLQMSKSRLLDREAFRRGDTQFLMKAEEYQAVIETNGFVKILDIPFTPEPIREDEPPTEEHQYVYWHPERYLLLIWTTHRSMVNGGNVYFNLRLKDGVNWPSARISGGVALNDARVFVGSLDCREFLFTQLLEMEEEGEFIPWIEPPYLWLCHYGDDLKESKHAAANIYAKRILLFPKHVLQGMGLEVV